MATQFPRTNVGGVSLPRLLIGSNWFLGYSHTTTAQDKFIKEYQTRDRIASVICVFLEYGIDAVMGPAAPLLIEATNEAEQRTGKRVTRIITPHFNLPGTQGPADMEPEAVFDNVKKMGATFCMPHTCITDTILDKLGGTLRGMDRYSRLIRERGMIPGLSTHMPEAIVIADRSGADVETYISLYNAAGFLMHVEVEWINRIIVNAKKPVMTIKPLAAGRLTPMVGFGFVWNTLREKDMVTIGTTTPDEARECIEISLSYLERRVPEPELQKTRSKKSLE